MNEAPILVKKTMMRIGIIVLGLLLLLVSSVQAADRSPNILFVLFDDMGWGQSQSYDSSSALRTPEFDRLVSQGMRFTDAHSAAAVCTPTRYGVLTGRYPSRIGQFGVLTTFSKPIIPTSRLTVASLLKKHGYHTACVGKWHLGLNWVDGKPGSERSVPIGARMTGGPNDLGFDYFCGFTHARNIGSVIEQDRVVAHVELVDNQPLMLEKAIKYIDDRAKSGEPFFLYFPMCPPHEPIVPTAEFVGKSGADDVVQQNPKYGDWVYQGDAMLGALLAALDRNGISENTLVIATSDNGAEHRQYAPLRDSKRSIYEGGHRVPFVARWPAKVPAASVCDTTICLNDLMATCAEIVKAELPDEAGEDSVSLLPLLLNSPTVPSKALGREATVHQSASGDLAIRAGDWKLVFMNDGSRELYNLRTDIGEVENVLSQNLQRANKLEALMHSYIETGRSTAGVKQKNDFELSLTMTKKKKPNK